MKKLTKSEAAVTLRKKAEDLQKKKPSKSASPLSDADNLKLIHELEVYQIELEKQIEVMRHRKDIGLLCADMIDFDVEGEEDLSHFQKRGLGCEYFGDKLLVNEAFRKIFHQNFISTPTVLMRREIVIKAGNFPEDFRFAEDYIYWLRVARVTDRCWGKLPCLIVLAFHTGMRAGSLLMLKWQDIDLVAKTAYVRRTKNGDPYVATLTDRCMTELKRLRRENRILREVELIHFSGRLRIWLTPPQRNGDARIRRASGTRALSGGGVGCTSLL